MKKRLSSFLAVFTVLSALSASFFGCNEASFNGTSAELGITLEGGGYDSSCTLVASKVTESINVSEVMSKIADIPYNKNAEIFIYYITVTKNRTTVDPSGNVKITLPEPNADYDDYAVFHVTDSGAESLTYTVSDGSISFEATGLYYFVIANSHVHRFGKWINTGDSHERECQLCGYTETEAHILGDGAECDTGIVYHCKKCDHERIENEYVTLCISLLPDPSAFSSFSVSGVEYAKRYENSSILKGSNVTVSVTPAEGYTFTGWYTAGDDELISKDRKYTFNMTSTFYVVARFTKDSSDKNDIHTPIV